MIKYLNPLLLVFKPLEYIRSFTFYGWSDGDSSTPTQTTSTVTQYNIPDWLRPQTESVIGAATQNTFNTTPNASGGLDITGVRPYVPYSTNPSDYVASFSPMQQQSYQGVANMALPGQYGVGTNMAYEGGIGGLNSANTALNYGTQGAGYGAAAANAGQNYVNQATNPASVQAYMSPYMQAVTEQAKQGAIRDYDVLQTQRNANATKAGAFGGSRSAIENAEAQRALSTQLQGIQSSGLQNAFANAQQAQQYGAGLGMQGLQTGITGANAGLAGVQQAQAGYGLGANAGATLSNIGTAQQAAQQGIYGLQNTYGQQQTQQQQDIINNAINNYAMAQQYPQQQLSFLNSIVRGYATPTTSAQNYAVAPSAISQLGGLAATGLGAYMAKSAKTGGKIEEPKKYAGGGLVDLAIANAMEGV